MNRDGLFGFQKKRKIGREPTNEYRLEMPIPSQFQKPEIPSQQFRPSHPPIRFRLSFNWYQVQNWDVHTSAAFLKSDTSLMLPFAVAVERATTKWYFRGLCVWVHHHPRRRRRR